MSISTRPLPGTTIVEAERQRADAERRRADDLEAELARLCASQPRADSN
ncbi:MAG TPA: hypothetical protein VGX78_11035 [Pirellulales bacterium]|jgi:hypothetical protein|nr:hypothetical protein [Pirellulales bacterium]